MSLFVGNLFQIYDRQHQVICSKMTDVGTNLNVQMNIQPLFIAILFPA